MSDEHDPVRPRPDPRYRHLPEPVRLEDTVAEQETRPVPDPDGGIDPEQVFFLRYGAPL